ncbi:hypothetical protein DBV13_05440 [Trueperella pyogenes]|nr:hypothetical protein DBV13_05440 [Trueperella pyogenes]
MVDRLMGALDNVDYRIWDWLPSAATEVEIYLRRMLTGPSIKAHNVSSRAKTIASFQNKCRQKNYSDPLAEVTDVVAARIITYSRTDRERVCDLIRDRFIVKEDEDRNPGAERPYEARGYDCHHFIVIGENATNQPSWLVEGGDLARYFEEFGGLEIQVRTVAAHAWAEFEHARRYKGKQFHALSEHDQATIDLLFAAAADTRSSLDEIFVAIDRVIARPAVESRRPEEERKEKPVLPEWGQGGSEADSPVDEESLRQLLNKTYPRDKRPTKEGLAFGLELVQACGLTTMGELAAILKQVDSERVQELMAYDISVTQVRRLDDDLLAFFGEDYLATAGVVGNRPQRPQQLGWRYDRIRGKV